MYFKQLAKHRFFGITVLVILILLIKGFASNSFWVEKYFTAGFFSGFSKLLRLCTGWLPFSIGDVLYFFAGSWLLYKVIRFFIKLARNKFRARIPGRSLLKIVLIGMGVYIIFNIFWGLNYNRKGIAEQLGLQTQPYTPADLKNIQRLLVEKVNESKRSLINTNSVYPGNKELFSRANKCYRQTELLYPFMQYKYESIKSSLFSSWGNYLGFTGYYNPFTGEAQLNTTVPRFVLPYTTCHEIAHQIGYAKEDEANFAGYLAAISSTDTLFHYSAYLDLFLYANREVYFVDSVAAKQGFTQLSPGVKQDIKELRDFLIKHRSFVDAWVTWAYGKYLKANQQPQGMRTYTEVIAGLIAFYKKTGRI